MGFIKKIFRPNIPSVPTTTITGRDLLSSTSSEEPDSPQMGTDGVNQKKRGINSLLVQSENIYKGGV
jgi:hypothetical protein